MKDRNKRLVPALAGILLLSLMGCGGSTNTSKNTPPTIHNAWTWVGGSNRTDLPGIYGKQGMADPANVPGARAYAASWVDSGGNLWLFGGIDGRTGGDLNDLWKYSNGEWTWMSGSNQTEQAGTYGTKGIASPANIPGARDWALSWADPAGNLWLFGGVGLDSAGTRADLNDLWKYSNGAWTWMSGSNVGARTGTAGAYQGTGVYGTKGIADPGNAPGARFGASSWADAAGNLWLFGGLGVDSNSKLGLLNDLWKFSGGEWTWMAGSNLVNQFGTYGTLGTPTPANSPGARAGAATWADAAGNLWLFGGDGNDVDGTRCLQTGSPCDLSDLWKFSGGQWTWIGGPNQANEAGVYGTQGVAAPGNIPEPRTNALTWTDTEGNLWLFGGIVWAWDYNDLWKYSNGQWTWMSGANQACQSSVYGTQGTPSTSNVLGARDGSASWIDKSGNLWVFGGETNFCTLNHKLNDLWEYQP